MIRLSAALLALAMLAMPASAKTIKLGTLVPEGTPYYDVIRDIGDRWERLSGGRIKLRIYAGGIAGDETDLVKKMRIGQIHAAAITGGGLADITTKVRALQLPMMFRNYGELDYVRARVNAEIQRDLARKGFRVLVWGDAGWIYFFSRSRVTRPAHLRRLKLFVWTGNTTFIETWKKLGYQPVPVAATDIHLGLASGLIDSITVPAFAALSYQWFGQAKHMTQLKFAPLIGGLVISERMWQSIDPELRPKLIESVQFARREFDRIRMEGPKMISVMQRYGLQVHPVSPEEYGEWEALGRKGRPYLADKVVSGKFMARVTQLRDEYRNLKRTP